jgi:sortase A
VSIVDPDITAGAGASGEDGSTLEGAVAYCPHCSAPVGEGVSPWPPEPTRCPACEQWIGRNRASTEPPDGAPAPTAHAAPAAHPPEVEEHEAHHRGRRHKPASRIGGFLKGRHAEENGELAEGSPEVEDAPAAVEHHAPPAAEDREPVATDAPPDAAEMEQPPPAEIDEPPAEIDEPPAALDEPPARDEPRSEVEAPPPARRAAPPRRAGRTGSLMKRSRMRRLASTFGLATPPEPSAPAPGAEAHEPPAVEDAPAPADRDAVLAEVDEPDAFAHEPAAAEVEFDDEDDEFADEDEQHRALRTVAAQVAVARLATGKAAPTRLPSLPRPQKKLQPPRVTLPRRRPAPPKAEPAERRGAGRYAGITMVVVGMLILAYGTITLVWQDPWTAWQTARAQKRAKVEYDKIVKDFRKSTSLQTKQATRAWLHRQAALFNLNTPEGDPVGRLSIPKIDVKFTIVQGTEESTLAKGPAHYVETPLPGAKGKWTMGIAGHRTTYLAPFRRINELSPGDHVNIAMPYGRFYYVVEKTKIVDATDETVLAADQAITGRKPYNRLALTACHPPFSAAQRIIVYSRLLRYKVAKSPS